MATQIDTYLENFGTCPGQLSKHGVAEVVWDFSVKPVAAGDNLDLFLVPAGTRIQGYTIRTDAVPTSGAQTTISLGLTGATTGLASAQTPSATVGACIVGTTEVSALVIGKYMTATFATAQTSGKVTIQMPVYVMTPYNLTGPLTLGSGLVVE